MTDIHSRALRLARGRIGIGVGAAATGLAGTAVLVALMASMDRGFDLTDEAFYLLSMQEPAAYQMTGTLFGHVLHPVYLLLGGSIAALRLFGALMLAGIGAGATLVFLRLRRRSGEAFEFLPSGAIVLAGAVLPAMYYGYWLPTPSYNWLVLAAGLLLLPGILLLADRRQVCPAALAALAGLIAILAKPTTALAYATIFLAATVLLLREPRRIAVQLGLASGFTAAGLALLAFLLPLGTVLAQLHGYVELYGAAPPAGRGPIADLLAFLGHPRGWPFCAAALAAGLAAGSWRGDRIRRARAASAALALAALTAASALILGFPVYPALGPGMAAIACSAIALGLLRANLDRRTGLALSLAALLPWGAALGTANDTASQTTFFAGISGAVALMAAAAGGRAAIAVPVSLGLVLLTGSAVHAGLHKPFRLKTPVWAQTEQVELGSHGEHLKLDPRTAGFVTSIRESAARAGFCAGDPVLDFSGQLPGIALVLGGRTPGVPWLIGGYSFSDALASRVVGAMDPETRERAWLVVLEGHSRFAFSRDALRSFGFDLESAYESVFEGAHPLNGTPVSLVRPLARGETPGPTGN